MAAGAEAVSSGVRSSSTGGSSSGSSAALEATLDRRLQGVTNTMESIQNLSSFCIENKKQHALVVQHWIKWLRKSEANHRLNLFYLANDIIQNCKRRNAIAYRSTFAEVLPEAALLVKDGKVRKSVERIFNIWKERNVYPDELITELKANLQKKETPPPAAPVNPKVALKSKIVAEFAPQAFVERLLTYKRSLEESDLREKQLAALRVDACSTEALKCLKDKAGGNKFSKDFEEGSVKLQEFVRFLEGQMKAGPPLLEALGNADVFYEMQYKEVKIIAKAYQTFANRVSNLKRKLDALKATLPDLDESPVPSPLEDAPSPSGSESSSHELGRPPKDDVDQGDMDVSEEEPPITNAAAGAEDKEKSSPAAVSKPTSVTVTKSPTLTTPSKSAPEPAANQTTVSSSTSTTPTSPLSSTPLNLANVDLGKISSILSSLTNAMKNSGVSSSPGSRPSPGTPNTPSSHAPVPKAPPISAPAAPNPLASILSKVDISPEGILNALTKTNTHAGLSSLLSSARAGSFAAQNPAPSTATVTTATTTPTITTPTTPSTPKTPKAPESNSVSRDSEKEKEKEREKVKACERQDEETVMPSLESKINSFLQGNPGFAGVFEMESNSPLIVGGDATPVRDERGGTPTQDEIVDSPRSNTVRHAHKRQVSPWGSENNKKDRDYRVKGKEPEVAKRRGEPASGHAPCPSSSTSTKFPGQEVTSKAKAETRREKGKDEKAGRKKEQEVGGANEGYRCIETVVTAETGDGAAPIETLGYGYSNRIQTVESIRVIGRGPRRSSGASWYEEAEFMEAPPQHRHGNHASDCTDDLPPPPPHLLPQYPPPPPPPPLFFPSQAPPPHIAPLTPPPIPPGSFPPSPTTSAVMVGGIMVPIDRVLPLPPTNHRQGTTGGATAATPSSVKPHSLHPFHHPLLGPNPTPPSPTTPTAPATPSSRDPRPLLPSPPAPLLRLPSPTQRLPVPNSREPLLRGTKRPGSAYRGGLLRTPKRPYLPPRY